MNWQLTSNSATELESSELRELRNSTTTQCSLKYPRVPLFNRRPIDWGFMPNSTVPYVRSMTPAAVTK